MLLCLFFKCWPMWVWIIDSLCFQIRGIGRQNKNNKVKLSSANFPSPYQIDGTFWKLFVKPCTLRMTEACPNSASIFFFLPSPLYMPFFLSSYLLFYIKKIVLLHGTLETLQNRKCSGATGMMVICIYTTGWHLRFHYIRLSTRSIEYI